MGTTKLPFKCLALTLDICALVQTRAIKLEFPFKDVEAVHSIFRAVAFSPSISSC